MTATRRPGRADRDEDGALLPRLRSRDAVRRGAPFGAAANVVVANMVVVIGMFLTPEHNDRDPPHGPYHLMNGARCGSRLYGG